MGLGNLSYKKIYNLMSKEMPDITTITESAVKESIDEDQDMLFVIFGPPGKGKSNFAYLYCLLITYIVNQYLQKNRKFDLDKQAAWMAEDFVNIFEEPARTLVDILKTGNLSDVDKFAEKNRGKVFWLDEAKDLNVLDFLKTFNKSFSGILDVCRALQYIYVICIDTPTKLIPSIRDYRISAAIYSFITPKKKQKFKDGKLRRPRAAALYGKKEMIDILFSEPRFVRRFLNLPGRFINKFPPYTIEQVPLFPRGKMWDDYRILKYGMMGKNILADIEKIREKKEGKADKRKKKAENFVSGSW